MVSWAVLLPLFTSRFLREGALTPFRYRNVTFDEVKEVKPVLHELASGEAVELMRMEHRTFLLRRLTPSECGSATGVPQVQSCVGWASKKPFLMKRKSFHSVRLEGFEPPTF